MKSIKNKMIIIVVIITVIFSLGGIYYFYNEENKDIEIVDIEISTTQQIDREENLNEVYRVDIKGAIKNPGVYEMNANSIVNDVIEKAGGLNKNATTKNINLSQKIFDSMVIYVFTASELTTTSTSHILNDVKCTTNVIEVNNCINPTTTTTTTKKTTTTTSTSKNKETTTTTTKIINSNNKININTASKEELMSLSGIGASKADAIIEYRSENYFTKIEDIMNVSGIGEAAFEKIKDYITI